MGPLSITWMTLAGFICAFFSFLGFFAHIRAGGTPIIVAPSPAVVFTVATAPLIWSGLTVCRLRANRDTRIDAVGAMWVVMFARASTIVGSALTGVLIGVMIVSFTQLEASTIVANTITSGLSGLAGLVWVVVTLVVGYWCVIDPDDDGSSSSHKRSAAV